MSQLVRKLKVLRSLLIKKKSLMVLSTPTEVDEIVVFVQRNKSATRNQIMKYFTHISPRTIRRRLKNAIKMKLVNEQKRGRETIYIAR